MKEEIKDKPELHTLLYVDNEFIIPGGRFREFYYWDTYWTVKGLLASGLYNTAKGVIKNLVDINKRYNIKEKVRNVCFVGKF